MRGFFRTLLVISFVVSLGLSGLVLGGYMGGGLLAFAKDRYTDLQLFAKVLNLVQQYYVEEVDTKKLIYGGIKGMLKELDPHTNFLPPEIYNEFENETSGEFGGLGIEITIQDEILTVISPIEDTPAWKAGIKAGDKIVEINGESTKGLSLVEAAQKMRGKKGSVVKLGIFREGFESPKVFAIKRGTVTIKSVKYTNLNDGYVYIKLTSFIEKSGKDLKSALDSHLKKFKEIKGVIIDLRKNPGGLLEQAIEITDYFITQGVIVSTMGRNEKEKEIVYAKKEGTLPIFPLIVLIDEYSASASEILAGALQDNKRALIMGQRSFGKGSVQSVVKLGDGSGLKLTVARYYTPSGKSIQAEGIQPDVKIQRLDPELYRKAIVTKKVKREKDIQGHLKGEKEKELEESGKKNVEFWWAKLQEEDPKDLNERDRLLRDDFQVMQAYNYLKAWKVMQSFSNGESKAQQK